MAFLLLISTTKTNGLFVVNSNNMNYRSLCCLIPTTELMAFLLISTTLTDGLFVISNRLNLWHFWWLIPTTWTNLIFDG